MLRYYFGSTVDSYYYVKPLLASLPADSACFALLTECTATFYASDRSELQQESMLNQRPLLNQPYLERSMFPQDRKS